MLCHEIISYLTGLSLEAQRPHTVGEWAEVNSGGAWVLPLIYHSWITHPRCVLIHSHTHATHHSPHYYVSMANHNFDNSAAAVNYIIDNASWCFLFTSCPSTMCHIGYLFSCTIRNKVVSCIEKKLVFNNNFWLQDLLKYCFYFILSYLIMKLISQWQLLLIFGWNKI